MSNEPILDPRNARLTIFPIRYPKVYDLYDKAKKSFWIAEEIDLMPDINDWEQRLTNNERNFIKNVLAFFATSDALVQENVSCNFMEEVTIPEARAFYAIQTAVEQIHQESYGRMLNIYITDETERSLLFDAVKTVPTIKRKADWQIKYMNRDMPFNVRLVAFAIVEGLFFSSSFAAIFWLKERGLMPGLCMSNELISRDEGLHTEFAVLLYKMLYSRVDNQTMIEMMESAAAIEVEFVNESLPVNVIGLNADLLRKYIYYCADRLLSMFGIPERQFGKHYIDNGSYACPLPFMDRISLEGKTNFFEHRPTEYQKSTIQYDLANDDF